MLALAGLGGCGGGGGSSAAAPAAGAGAAASYSVGGSVAGLSGTVTLQDNGGDTLNIGADGTFAFATSLASGSSYSVTIQAQPSGQVCTVTNPSGTVASANVTNLGVSCTANAGAGSPSADLLALAATYSALRVASALPVIVAVAESATPCSAGTVTIAPSPFDATFSGCATTFDSADTFSGSVTSSFIGVGPTGLHGVTIANSAPLGATAAMADTQISAVASVAGSTLTEVLSIGSLSFTMGSGSTYQLGTFTIGSPEPMTRETGAGGVTSTIPAAAGSVTYNDTALQMTLLAPVVWTDAAAPTAGALQIDNGSALSLQVQFLSNGQVRLSDPLTGLTATKAWTDADVQAALRSVTQ